jgi:hypothetical protein
VGNTGRVGHREPGDHFGSFNCQNEDRIRNKEHNIKLVELIIQNREKGEDKDSWNTW